jgi:hypothetical protein
MTLTVKRLFFWSGIFSIAVLGPLLFIGVTVVYWMPMLAGFIMIMISRKGIESKRTFEQLFVLLALWALSITPWIMYYMGY